MTLRPLLHCECLPPNPCAGARRLPACCPPTRLVHNPRVRHARRTCAVEQGKDPLGREAGNGGNHPSRRWVRLCLVLDPARLQTQLSHTQLIPSPFVFEYRISFLVRVIEGCRGAREELVSLELVVVRHEGRKSRTGRSRRQQSFRCGVRMPRPCPLCACADIRLRFLEKRKMRRLACVLEQRVFGQYGRPLHTPLSPNEGPKPQRGPHKTLRLATRLQCRYHRARPRPDVVVRLRQS
jgi:hypothetical protein